MEKMVESFYTRKVSSPSPQPRIAMARHVTACEQGRVVLALRPACFFRENSPLLKGGAITHAGELIHASKL